jgi:hypothetical protein
MHYENILPRSQSNRMMMASTTTTRTYVGLSGRSRDSGGVTGTSFVVPLVSSWLRVNDA